MGLYDIKPRFRQLLTPLADRLAWVHPDAITMAGVVASVFAFLCLRGAPERRWLLLMIPVCLFARIACNALDGLVAQRTGKARAFGEVLNEGMDRLSDLVLILGLGLTPWASFGPAAWAAIAVLLASYAGLMGKAVGVGREYGGVLGKADRMLWLGIASLWAWRTGLTPLRIGGMSFRSVFELLLWLFIPLAAITMVQRIQRIRVRLVHKESS